MGYTTDFNGSVTIEWPNGYKAIAPWGNSIEEFVTNWNAFANTRHMAFLSPDLDPVWGPEGAFLREGVPVYDNSPHWRNSMVKGNDPPIGVPGLWCQWVIHDDYTKGSYVIEWDGCEKFYNYVEWLVWMIQFVLEPSGATCEGTILWYGESKDDYGTITVQNNFVTAQDEIEGYTPDDDEDDD